jgi:ABC-type lipoprotein release transport system permease subunit
MLEQLELIPTGAIITQDIAERYGLSTGGVLRAFWRNETELEALEFSIIGVVDALPDTLTFETVFNPYPGIEWTYEVGLGKVWVNREDIDLILSYEKDVENVYCIRVEDISNATLIAEEHLSNGWADVLEEDVWVSASDELEVYITQDVYILDRATDTLFTIVSVGAIFGAFTVYAIEGVKSRKREIALLRSIGADRNLVIKTQAAEMLVLFLISVMLLCLFTPVLTVNSLLAAIRSYGGVTYVYPSPVTIITPLLMMIVILSFFLFCIAIFISVIATLSSRVNMSEALNSTWTDSSPYVEGA